MGKVDNSWGKGKVDKQRGDANEIDSHNKRSDKHVLGNIQDQINIVPNRCFTTLQNIKLAPGRKLSCENKIITLLSSFNNLHTFYHAFLCDEHFDENRLRELYYIKLLWFIT